MITSATSTDFSLQKDALSQFVSIHLSEWCQEAKIQYCRAYTDFSTCGRYVRHKLSSCGHASLCEECSLSCSSCPICRTTLPTSGRVSLRLYDKCVAAGLIKPGDDQGIEKSYTGEHLDVQRLYSLFDVALESNLVSSICHYVTDVCLDENAVSSDPVVAFLLDEVVVKNWCRLKYKSALQGLREIYALEDAIHTKMNLLLKFSSLLTGISNVLGILESSFAGSLSAELQDLHWLLENTSKTKQHLDIIIWCSRHNFLVDNELRFSDSASWSRHFRERKLAATERTWPNSAGNRAESTLFVEDALSNLLIEQDLGQSLKDELDARTLIKDMNTNLSAGPGVSGIYPFLDLRSAADILFLHGSSDMSVAKRAIFLYYLFDRHWSTPDDRWKKIVDDFADSFGIKKRSVLESLIFYLLDDHSEDALQQASEILPQIVGPDTHPKVAKVLLERQLPELALTVLRCCGNDSISGDSLRKHDASHHISLDVAVTVIRVKIECGLLTEAFVYLQTYCARTKNYKTMVGSSKASLDDIQVLVTEICSLCIRRNLVDRMIELPWSSDEEPFLHKIIFEKACEEPSSISGSLLVVYYLQRYRYVEAYQVDKKLQSLEQKFFQSASEVDISKIRSISLWRERLVTQSLELLPEVQRLQVKSKSHNDYGEEDCMNVDWGKESPSSTDAFIEPYIVLKQNLSSDFVVEDFGKHLSFGINGDVPASNGFTAGKFKQRNSDLSSRRFTGSPVAPFQGKLSRSAAPTRFQVRNADSFSGKTKFSTPLKLGQTDSISAGSYGRSVASKEKHTGSIWRFEERDTPMATTTDSLLRWRSDDSGEEDDRAEPSMTNLIPSLKRRGRQER